MKVYTKTQNKTKQKPKPKQNPEDTSQKVPENHKVYTERQQATESMERNLLHSYM